MTTFALDFQVKFLAFHLCDNVLGQSVFSLLLLWHLLLVIFTVVDDLYAVMLTTCVTYDTIALKMSGRWQLILSISCVVLSNWNVGGVWIH